MTINAAFYLADPTMIGSRLFDQIESIQSYEGLSDKDGATGFILTMPWGTIKANIMPSNEIVEHLAGFEGYIRNQLEEGPDLEYTLSRLHNVRICLGCNITHDQEFEEDVYKFLFRFNSLFAGLMFLNDSVWDWSGEPLCGPYKND